MIEVALLRRYVLLDVPGVCDIRINRNDTVTLNAGRYQIDTRDGVEVLEVDDTIEYQVTPVGLGFLTSVDGLPVSGPLTQAQLAAMSVPVREAAGKRMLFVAAATASEKNIAAAILDKFPDIPTDYAGAGGIYTCDYLKVQGYLGTLVLRGITSDVNNVYAIYDTGAAGGLSARSISKTSTTTFSPAIGFGEM